MLDYQHGGIRFRQNAVTVWHRPVTGDGVFFLVDTLAKLEEEERNKQTHVNPEADFQMKMVPLAVLRCPC